MRSSQDSHLSSKSRPLQPVGASFISISIFEAYTVSLNGALCIVLGLKAFRNFVITISSHPRAFEPVLDYTGINS
ncbi:hypothetical protein DTO027B5_3095 [Paecilomyces variotii]|nr:hypothetical protein DTO021C3_6589 [Paecilomyces variotii]KAJ9319874.1 hypothetical protein DTO027B3_9102 [Paecilomyces variotii]KAJ9335132.1 hypothetical protein DTO027B5_3095 [Paecilomyces variotii]